MFVSLTLLQVVQEYERAVIFRWGEIHYYNSLFCVVKCLQALLCLQVSLDVIQNLKILSLFRGQFWDLFWHGFRKLCDTNEFRLGRLRAGGAKGPGLFFIMPCIDTYKKVDLRTVSFDVPPQEVILLRRDSRYRAKLW